MATVTVGCKLPHGIHLDVAGKRITLAGANSSAVFGGHGITEGVDKDLFDRWMSLNKDSAAVKKGLIFAHEKTGNVRAEATDKVNNITGFEGLDPSKPAPGITPDDNMKMAA